MNFLELVFVPFIAIFLLVYFITPRRYRYIVIFIGSCVFYGYADPKILLVLLLATGISYLGGGTLTKDKAQKSSFLSVLCVGTSSAACLQVQ